jgi:tetratricopeptide (TPR) repeat protein
MPQPRLTQARLPAAIFALIAASFAQGTEGQFRLALPEHKGQIQWSAPGFKAVEYSAKSNGNEIGVRGRDQAGNVAFLGFLFVFSELAPLSSAKCNDGVLGPEKKANSSLKVAGNSEYAVPGAPPVSLITYSTASSKGKPSYMVRAFTATGDLCGDLEFYSDTPLSADDPLLKNILASYRLDKSYVPDYRGVFLYAQVLYNHQMYAAAAPRFELALAKLREHPEGDMKTMTRVLTDQAGMSYGISGNISKSRALLEKAIAEDPDYPMYYYNLACSDAEEKNFTAARDHLQKAFDRRMNVLSGEAMPDPTKDDSFLPYRSNKGFWTFLESLHPQP